jgi:hypothetical protein
VLLTKNTQTRKTDVKFKGDSFYFGNKELQCRYTESGQHSVVPPRANVGDVLLLFYCIFF